MTGGVSREDFDATIRAVSDVVSRFCPGSLLQTTEQTYRAWLICKIDLRRGVRVLYRGVVPKGSAGWDGARRLALEDMSCRGGWPLAFSGDEMRLRLSLLTENELRKLSQRCAIRGYRC